MRCDAMRIGNGVSSTLQRDNGRARHGRAVNICGGVDGENASGGGGDLTGLTDWAAVAGEAMMSALCILPSLLPSWGVCCLVVGCALVGWAMGGGGGSLQRGWCQAPTGLGNAFLASPSSVAFPIPCSELAEWCAACSLRACCCEVGAWLGHRTPPGRGMSEEPRPWRRCCCEGR